MIFQIFIAKYDYSYVAVYHCEGYSLVMNSDGTNSSYVNCARTLCNNQLFSLIDLNSFRNPYFALKACYDSCFDVICALNETYASKYNHCLVRLIRAIDMMYLYEYSGVVLPSHIIPTASKAMKIFAYQYFRKCYEYTYHYKYSISNHSNSYCHLHNILPINYMYQQKAISAIFDEEIQIIKSRMKLIIIIDVVHTKFESFFYEPTNTSNLEENVIRPMNTPFWRLLTDMETTSLLYDIKLYIVFEATAYFNNNNNYSSREKNKLNDNFFSLDPDERIFSDITVGYFCQYICTTIEFKFPTCYCTFVNHRGTDISDMHRNRLLKMAYVEDHADYVMWLNDGMVISTSLWLLAPLYHLQYHSYYINHGIVVGGTQKNILKRMNYYNTSHVSMHEMDSLDSNMDYILLPRSIFEIFGTQSTSISNAIDLYFHPEVPSLVNTVLLCDALSVFSMDYYYDYHVNEGIENGCFQYYDSSNKNNPILHYVRRLFSPTVFISYLNRVEKIRVKLAYHLSDTVYSKAHILSNHTFLHSLLYNSKDLFYEEYSKLLFRASRKSTTAPATAAAAAAAAAATPLDGMEHNDPLQTSTDTSQQQQQQQRQLQLASSQFIHPLPSVHSTNTRTIHPLPSVHSTNTRTTTMRSTNTDTHNIPRKNPRIAFITAIYGKYESTCKPYPRQTIPADFICFTDDPSIANNGWFVDTRPYHLELWLNLTYDWISDGYHNYTIEDLKHARNSILKNKHPYNISKFYKSCFHRIPRLAIYDVIVWMDGALRLHHERAAEILLEMSDEGDKNIMIFESFYGGKMKSELKHALFFAPKWYGTQWNNFEQPVQDVSEQYADYLRRGYNDSGYWNQMEPTRPNYGLWITCFMSFTMTAKETLDFLRMWYLELVFYTTECQLSFPFVAQMLRIFPYSLPTSDYRIVGDFEWNNLYEKLIHGL